MSPDRMKCTGVSPPAARSHDAQTVGCVLVEVEVKLSAKSWECSTIITALRTTENKTGWL